MSDEWGDWQVHYGMGCPLPHGTLVSAILMDPLGELPDEEAVFRVGERWETEHYYSKSVVDDWVWPMPIQDDDAFIVRYRVRRPRALLQLIEMVENLPAPAQPRVDA